MAAKKATTKKNAPVKKQETKTRGRKAPWHGKRVFVPKHVAADLRRGGPKDLIAQIAGTTKKNAMYVQDVIEDFADSYEPPNSARAETFDKDPERYARHYISMMYNLGELQIA